MAYDYPLRVVLSAGTQSPLYATAGGKAILAFYDNEEIEALLPEQFTAYCALSGEKRPSGGRIIEE